MSTQLSEQLKRELDEGAELGADWERWSTDGRPHRLKRKRDFDDVDPAFMKLAAKNAAERLGKAVHVFADPFFAEKFVWIQFADHKVATGKPCPCGSRRLYRLHKNFARCAECRAQLLLKDEGDSEHLVLLRKFTKVYLELVDTTHKRRDAYRGYALKGKKHVLLFAEFRKDELEPLSLENVYERIEKTNAIPFERLDGFVDVDRLLARDDSQWDFVFEAPEPEPDTEPELESVADEPLD